MTQREPDPLKEERYLIGEVGKITGLSKNTLHFYNKIGLLVPDYIDETNQYRYYSRWNLWQLDIITICRKLSIPLEKVKQILDLQDNGKITQLLMEYRDEALALSSYYRQVADDILWYHEEGQRIAACTGPQPVRLEALKKETVIAGVLKRKQSSYHANLQEAVKDVLQHTSSIKRRYGYIMGLEQFYRGELCKCREYMKVPDPSTLSKAAPETLYTIPAGAYAVCMVHIVNHRADLSPLFSWLEEHHFQALEVYAEEVGLQLFNYIDDYYCELKVRLKTGD